MPLAEERTELHVEGDDDLHSLVHLLVLHGVDYDCKPWPSRFPVFKVAKTCDQLLRGMETAVRASAGRAAGFVLDADAPLSERWREICRELAKTDIATPSQPPPDGFIGQSNTYRTRVGVWLMPDNQHEGKLEDFLRTLVAEEDSLIDHATASTDRARELGAGFSDPDCVKAIIRAWLAWQEEPGHP